MERASSLPSLYDVREVSYPRKAGSWYRMLTVCELHMLINCLPSLHLEEILLMPRKSNIITACLTWVSLNSGLSKN